MTNNIENYINEINRLMKYDRSKTIIEQYSTSVEVGIPKASVKQDQINSKRYKTKSEISGESFNYPNYCKRPDLAVPGTVEKPAFNGWCKYRIPGGENKTIYLPKDAEIISTIDSKEDVKDLYDNFMYDFNEKGEKYFNSIGEKYGEESENYARNDFYNQLLRIFTIGSVRSFKLLNTVYSVKTIGSVQPLTNKTQINILWRFGGFHNKKTNVLYNEPNINILKSSGTDILWYEGINLANKGFKELSSIACGDKSPFKSWGKVGLLEKIGLEYGYEEMACDVLATLLFFINPVGSVAVEFLHAYDLWENKDDKFGATVSMTLGMLPIIGDFSSSILKQLIQKTTKQGFIKVLTVFTNYIKFLTGEVKATAIWDSFKRLSKNERKLLFEIYATSSEFLSKASSLKTYIKEATKNLQKSGLGELEKKSLEKVIEILEHTAPLNGIINTALQMGGIFTNIFGAATIKSLGGDPKNTSPEEAESLIQELLNMEDNGVNLFGEVLKQDFSDEEIIKQFNDLYPCVVNHPNAKQITYNRRINDNSIERESQVAYDINGDIYFYDGLRKRKSEPDIRLTKYNCDSSVFNQD